MRKLFKNESLFNIVILGLISFFADISSEMVYPIIPLYLTGAFGATPALVGTIEGIAESAASLLKVFSGYISDKYHHKKQLAFLGYSGGVIYKIMLLVASSWSGVLAGRVIDRIGKGIRTAPRDVMVSENAAAGHLGKSFGIHKALDMAGASIGILLALLLLTQFHDSSSSDFKLIFAWSIVPALISLMMFKFIKEKPRHAAETKREPFWTRIGQLDRQLLLYLAITFIFTLGNSSNAFLLLRAQNVGFSAAAVVFLYFLYNACASVLAIPFGKRSDRVGRKRVLVLGYFVFAVVYAGFAAAPNKPFVAALFILYGLYTAMIAGVERAYIAEIAPPQLKGTMLGLQSTLAGIALLPASVIAGVLWTAFGAPAPFMFGAALSLIASLTLLVFMHGAPRAAE